MRGTRIVVIDDHQPFLTFMADLCAEAGYEVVPWPDGATAYELIQREQPDALVLDMLLDGPVSGLDLLGLLKRDPATAAIPVIICSTDDRIVQDHRELFQRARCQVLKKPFDIDVLEEMLSSVTTRASSQDVRPGSGARHDHDRAAYQTRPVPFPDHPFDTGR